MSISGYFNPDLHYRKYSELNKLNMVVILIKITHMF